MSSSPQKSVFHQALPITFTSFVNKIGDIGIRVLPMLLVQINASANESSLAMSVTKGSAILSTFFGGWLSDRIRARSIIMLSFLLSAVGMLCLAGTKDLTFIIISATLASFGQGLFASPLRLLLFETTEPGKRQEALAWLRSGNNAAVMTASAVSYLLAGVGLAGLFLFDATTSLIAIIAGFRLLPRGPADSTTNSKPSAMTSQTDSKAQDSTYFKFASLALLVALFTLLCELFFVSAAALAQKQFGNSGIKIFSLCFMINTGLCMLLSVKASRMITNAKFSFSFSIISQAAALILLLLFPARAECYFIAILLQTTGEIIFASMSQYSLMKKLPDKKRQGTIYSVALLMQQFAKMLAAALAFQLVGHSIKKT